ncbi:DUF2795 domain-containing protein [Burkholderia ubonensis]|uniref:DUF2795 domain-containing protein n=1 Tax=Burkholderia ubonensis TaxID=101571 RepID=UPI002ABDF826|nr:DUF2795 domain-containing protein [Burkholderia ubonensis]
MASHLHGVHEPGQAHVLDDEPVQQGHEEGASGKPPSPIEIQKALKGMAYPAGKADLVRCAEHAHASRDVLDLLMRIPEREYGTPAAVSKELGRLPTLRKA